ncbi:hypothetical protein ES707_06312 [subsurface metagenome]
MKGDELNKKVTEELKHIPRIKGDLPQNFFRSRYNGMRRHGLSRNPALPAKGSLLKAIETMSKDKPDFLPIYDRDFFGN